MTQQLAPRSWSEERDLEPFEDTRPPPFPTEVLPEPLREFTELTAARIQTSEDGVAMLALAALSLPVSQVARVRPCLGHVEPASLWVVLVEEPGARKSSVHAAVTRPIREIEKERQGAARSKVEESMSQRRILEKRLDAAERDVAKGAEGAAAEHAAALQALDEHVDVVAPQLMTSDATPEALAEALAKQGGVLGAFSAEAQLFDIAAGVYGKSGVVNIGPLLSAYDAETFTVNRRGGPPVIIEDPRLAACLAVQPTVTQELRKNERLDGRGFVGRWCYVCPSGIVGYRRARPDVDIALADIARKAYETMMRQLFDLEQTCPYDELPVIGFDTAAQDAFDAFFEEVEAAQRPSGRFHSACSWASKLHGKVARIALVLHVATWRTEAVGRHIDLSMTEAAIAIGRYLAEHAVHALEGTVGGAVQVRTRRLLAVIVDAGNDVVSPSELHRNHLKRAYPDGPESMLSEFEELERRGYVRRAPWADPPTSKKRTSPRYEVRPEVLSRVSVSPCPDVSGPDRGQGDNETRDTGAESLAETNGTAEGVVNGSAAAVSTRDRGWS